MTEEQQVEAIETLMDFGILRVGVDGFMSLGNLEFVRQTGGMDVVRILGKLVYSTNERLKRSLVLQRGTLPFFHFTKEGLRQKILEEKKD